MMQSTVTPPKNILAPPMRSPLVEKHCCQARQVVKLKMASYSALRTTSDVDEESILKIS